MSAYAAGMVEGTGTVDEAAAAVGLGERGGAFTAVQHIPVPVAWAVVGAAAVTGLLLSFARAYIVAALLVPAALIGLAVVRYRLAPSGGRRRLMLYQHGMAEVVTPPGGPPRLRLIRWDDVSGLAADATRADARVLTVAGPPDQPAATVRLADLTPAATLRAALRRHLPALPWPAERSGTTGRAALAAAGFAALALLPVLVPAARGVADRDVAQTATQPTAPATSNQTSTAGQPTRTPSPSGSVSGSAGAPSGFRELPMPTSTAGYHAVCEGNAVVPGAPPYAGPPPHLAYAPAPTFIDREYYAGTASEVQVVVCIKTSAVPGGRVRTCNYRFTDGTSASQTMVRTTWEVTLREARTGRVIVAATFVGGDTTCSRFPDYNYSSLPPTIAKEQRSRATDQQRYQYANKYLGATV
jgi:hypothetical protein